MVGEMVSEKQENGMSTYMRHEKRAVCGEEASIRESGDERPPLCDCCLKDIVQCQVGHVGV